MTNATPDLINRMDAIQACQVGPSDEWSKSTKSGYAQAATDCARNILRIEPAPNAGAVKVNEEQNTEQRKVFWNWLPLAYRDGHIGEEPKFSKYNMEVAHYAGWAAALETTPDPRDEVIARLVEAAEKLASWDHCWPGNINLEWEIGKLRAALAAAKEVMK